MTRRAVLNEAIAVVCEMAPLEDAYSDRQVLLRVKKRLEALRDAEPAGPWTRAQVEAEADELFSVEDDFDLNRASDMLRAYAETLEKEPRV